MHGYVYPGHPAFVTQARLELDLDPGLPPGPAQPALVALSGLAAQATMAPRSDATLILREAGRFLDQLRVAARAGELILGAVGSATTGDLIDPAERSDGASPVPPAVRVGLDRPLDSNRSVVNAP